MNPEQFAYWLTGFVELAGDKVPTPEQWLSICQHLDTVLTKTTPPLAKPAAVVAPGTVKVSPNEALQRLMKEIDKQAPSPNVLPVYPQFPYHPVDVNPPMMPGIGKNILTC
jgi:hypothetical protein